MYETLTILWKRAILEVWTKCCGCLEEGEMMPKEFRDRGGILSGAKSKDGHFREGTGDTV